MKRFLFVCLLIAVLAACMCLASCGHEHVFEGWEQTEEPTCTTVGTRVGTCACGTTATESVPAKGHGRTVQRIARDATCAEEGVLSAVCSVCEQTVDETPIPTKAHTEVTEITEAPSCRNSGMEETYCTVCDTLVRSRVLPMEIHTELAYSYNCDATATAEGTATAACPHCDYTDTKTLVGSAAMIAQAFAGKKISILGDSISSYINITSGIAANTTNSTVRDNIVWYGYSPSTPVFGGASADSTWWQRAINALGATRLVNNSNSGESVLRAVLNRCMQLHDDTGDNAGECPDIIFIYLGTNDYNRTMGQINTMADTEIARKGDNMSFAPSTLAEAYAVMLYRIQKTYPDAEIYCLTNLERSDVDVEKTAAVCEVIRQVVARFDGVHLVDIAEQCGIRRDAQDFETYIPKDAGNKSIHPGVEGMKAIAKVLLKVITENSRYMPEGFDELPLE